MTLMKVGWLHCDGPCVVWSISDFSNADDKKFEFDFARMHQHNPLTLVSCSPPFDAETR